LFPCVYAEITILALVPLFPLDDIVRIGTVSKLSNCRSCKKQATRLQFPSLAPIPQKIIDVPYSKENTHHLFFYNQQRQKKQIRSFVVLFWICLNLSQFHCQMRFSLLLSLLRESILPKRGYTNQHKSLRSISQAPLICLSRLRGGVRVW